MGFFLSPWFQVHRWSSCWNAAVKLPPMSGNLCNSRNWSRVRLQFDCNLFDRIRVHSGVKNLELEGNFFETKQSWRKKKKIVYSVSDLWFGERKKCDLEKRIKLGKNFNNQFCQDSRKVNHALKQTNSHCWPYKELFTQPCPTIGQAGTGLFFNFHPFWEGPPQRHSITLTVALKCYSVINATRDNFGSL